MSVMSQPIQDIENLMPVSDPPPRASDDTTSSTHRFKTLLRMLGGALLLPLLLLAAVCSFLFVLADFAFFRLRDLRNGHPEPKGLWEF